MQSMVMLVWVLGSGVVSSCGDVEYVGSGLVAYDLAFYSTLSVDVSSTCESINGSGGGKCLFFGGMKRW